MSTFCIPKQLAKKLRDAAVKGDINVKQLYEMTSEERRSFFKFYTDETTAKGINAGFERAMASEQKNALAVWAKNTFTAKEKKSSGYKNLVDKINNLSTDRLLNPENREGFLQDAVAEKLGATISADEAKKLDELSTKLQAEYAKGVDEFGLPDEGYWKARHEMDNYLRSITPSSNLKIATSTIGRAVMLASIKSPFINITGNTIQGISQAFERRIQNVNYAGVVDRKIINAYIKKINKIYSLSEYDVSRMQDISEGVKTLGEDITHSQGKGPVRFMGRVAEDLVFKQLLAKPDVFFSSLAFSDSANLMATRLAKEEGLTGKALSQRATDLFRDASSLSPTSVQGRIVRSQAIADAQLATFTNDSTLAGANLAARKILNDVTGDFRLGDQIMPFTKTPANVVSITLDSAGLSAIRGIRNLPQAVESLRAGDATLMRTVARDMYRTGFGMLAAFMISSLFDKDDFIGLYPTTQKEQELLKTKNANANSLRIGGKWVSVEYFGFLGSPLIGMLYAKKYKDNLQESMFNYAAGAFTQIQELPAIDPYKDVLAFIQDTSPGGKIEMKDLPETVINGAVDYIRARTVPGFVYDIAKAFDASEREVDYKNPLAKVKATIPGLRQTLPEKIDVFGEVIKGEPAYSVMLFGARVKTERDNKIITELRRLDETGNLPSITRPEKTSTRVKEFKTQVDVATFDKAMERFRSYYRKRSLAAVDSEKYKSLTDEDKKKVFDHIKEDSLNTMLEVYKYKPVKK